MNTNYRAPSAEELVLATNALDRALAKLFSSSGPYLKDRKWTTTNKIDLPWLKEGKSDNAEYDPREIHKIKVTYTLEIGPRFRFLHSHIYLVIAHRTNLMIDVDYIRDKFVLYLAAQGWHEAYKNKKTYVNVKTVTSGRIMDYLKKDNPKKVELLSISKKKIMKQRRQRTRRRGGVGEEVIRRQEQEPEEEQMEEAAFAVNRDIPNDRLLVTFFNREASEDPSSEF